MPPIEINSGNEALSQLRPIWDKVLVALMNKCGVKELTLDAEDVAKICPPNPTVFLVVLGRKHLGPDKGFTICLTSSKQEMTELIAKHSGQG